MTDTASPAAAAAAGGVPPTGWTTRGRVVRVVDGDTLDVEVSRTLRIRLLDCWAPELRAATTVERMAACRAARALAELVEGREVVLHVPTGAGGDLAHVFTFGRVLGRVYIDGQDVSHTLVAAGLATEEKS